MVCGNGNGDSAAPQDGRQHWVAVKVVAVGSSIGGRRKERDGGEGEDPRDRSEEGMRDGTPKMDIGGEMHKNCLLYTSPSPRDS